jgi:hypothetical protein
MLAACAGIWLAQPRVMNIKETNPGANVPKQPADAPLGDRGGHDKTWQPPAGEQGVSNREGDEESEGQAREPRRA